MSKNAANSGLAKFRAIGSSTRPQGIIPSSDGGFAIAAHELPASDHFFCATNFATRVDDASLHILFTQKSAWDPTKAARLALEIVFPLDWAAKTLYDSIWNHPGADGIGPFIDAVMRDAKTRFSAIEGSTKDVVQKLPEDPNCYRMLASNFSTSTLSLGQGMIEFFEVSPGLMANLIHRMNFRPNEGVKPVVSVIAPTNLLRDLYVELKPILANRVKRGVDE